MDTPYVYSNGIQKSFSDKKEYRLIRLENGLRAVLVSDVENIFDISEKQETAENGEHSDESEEEEDEDDDGDGKEKKEIQLKRAACALCVNVGSFSDPPEFLGLAHFVEHMVFMGSEKYPQENALDQFLSKRGGSDNGTTECEFTTFHIECGEEHLQKGMDIFSQFFVSPLMLREAMTREREAIDSEFESVVPLDKNRAEQVLGTLAPEGHPAGQFSWGNLVTLRDRVSDDELYRAGHDFRKKYYSAHLMTVAVIARLSLDTLEDYVRRSFSHVPNNGLPTPEFSRFKGLYGQGAFQSLVWLKPVCDLCEINLSWILPPLLNEYESRPLSYLAHVIGYEGKGSLAAYLKKKLWCININAGCDGSGFEFNSIYSMFSINMETTNEGIENLEEILLTVFEYLAVLRKSLPDKQYFDDITAVVNSKFKYQYEVEPASYAEYLCSNLQRKQPEHIAHNLFVKYQPEVIKETISNLSWDNVNILVLSQKPDDFYNNEEPWFKAKYRKEEIPSAWTESWKTAVPRAEFHIPEPNMYITTNFTIHESDVTNHPEYPEKIVETNVLEVWYRQDLKFLRPFAAFQLYLQSPVANLTPQNYLLLKIFTVFVQQKLDEEFYAAREAGYTWTLNVGDFGITIGFFGHDEKLPLFYEEVLKAIKREFDDLINPDNEPLFQVIKMDLAREIFNTYIEPSDLNKIARMSLLLQTYSTPMEIRSEIEHVDLHQLHDLCLQFFNAVHVKILIQGNITSETAFKVAHTLPTIFTLSPLKELPRMAVWNIPDKSETCMRVPSFSSEGNNAVITNYYQCGPYGGSVRPACVIELIMMILEIPLFDELRTNQQIGYDVSAELRDTFGILGFSLTIQYQTSKFTAEEVNNRLDIFLKEFAESLPNLSDDDFETTKKGLINSKKITDLSLICEVTRNFAEITCGEYNFKRLKLEAELIPGITRDEIYEWFKSHINVTDKCRKLSIQVHGSAPDTNISANSKDRHVLQPVCADSKYIQDIEEFRKNRVLYPPQMPLH